MGKQPIQESTYLDAESAGKLDRAAEEHGMSKAEILREGLRRQLQAMEVDA